MDYLLFSSKIFVEVVDNLKAETVAEAFKKVLKEFGSKIYELQVDAGSEFKGAFKALLKKNKIYFRIKRPPNKASVAEFSIFQVKKVLYRYMGSSQSHNWVAALPKVVRSLNATPLKKLGFLTPESITNEESSVFVDEALKRNHLDIPKEPKFTEQLQNQKAYEQKSQTDNKLLKKEDYVFVNLKSSGGFDKGYDVLVIKFRTSQKEPKILSPIVITFS